MTREEMWKEFESQLKSEVITSISMTMEYKESIRLAETGVEDVVARWKKRLEQDPLTDVLDKIRADVEQYQADCNLSCSDANCRTCDNITFGSIYRIIDKYRKGDKE